MIEEIEYFNISKNKSKTILLDKPLNIITGMNGTGKTSLLQAIHSATSCIHPQSYVTNRSNWGIKLKHKNKEVNFISLSFAMSEKLLPKDSESISYEFLKSRSFNEPVEDTYKSLINELLKNREPFTFQSISNNNQDLQAVTISYPKTINNEYNKTFNVECLYYSDGIIFFNGEKITKSKSEAYQYYECKNIEYSLEEVNKLLSKNLDNISTNSPKEILDKINKIAPNDKKLQAILAKQYQHISLSSQLTDELNKYFNQSGKEVELKASGGIIINDKKNHSEYNILELSKGEKTLITILIIAFINRDKEFLFILDEPETSLHIEWQEMLFGSIFQLCPKAKLIIATHSPAMLRTLGTDKENIFLV